MVIVLNHPRYSGTITNRKWSTGREGTDVHPRLSFNFKRNLAFLFSTIVVVGGCVIITSGMWTRISLDETITVKLLSRDG